MADFPIAPPSGDDERLHGAWCHARQAWQREEEAFLTFCVALSPAAMGVAARAMEHAETMTNETMALLFNEIRDARRRENERPEAA